MKDKYPLQDLLTIKIKRFDEAVRIFEEKAEELSRQMEKLVILEEERDEVGSHKADKIKQLRDALDAGTNTDKIRQMKTYLEVVEERLEQKQRKVTAQEKAVEKAEDDLELAKKKLFERKKDLEKLKIHKDEWKIEFREIEKRLEAVEQDEIGAIRDVLRKQEQRKKNK